MEVLLAYLNLDVYGIVLEYCSPYNLIYPIVNKEYDRVCLDRYGVIIRDSRKALSDIYVEEGKMLIEDSVDAGDESVITNLIWDMLKGVISSYYKNYLLETIVKSGHCTLLNFTCSDMFLTGLPLTGFIPYNPTPEMWECISDNFSEQYHKDQRILKWLKGENIPLSYSEALVASCLCTEKTQFEKIILYYPLTGLIRRLLWSLLKTDFVDLLPIVLRLLEEENYCEDIVMSDKMVDACIDQKVLFEILCDYSLKKNDISIIRRIYDKWGDFKPIWGAQIVSREVFEEICRITNREDLKFLLAIYGGHSEYIRDLKEIDNGVIPLFCSGHIDSFRALLERPIDIEELVRLCVYYRRKDLLSLLDIPKDMFIPNISSSMKRYIEGK